MDQEKMISIFRKHCKYDTTMGFELKIIAPGEIVYSVTIDERHLSIPDTCHGGVLSGMMDSTLGYTALTHAITKDMFCSTVEFKINYVSPALLGDQLEGTGQLEYKGQSLVVTTADIKNIKTGNLVAKGMGTFNLYPASKRDMDCWE